jgi:hypothetical protein
MATFEQHCKDCEREFGVEKRYEQIHRWLDELQSIYGPYHRVFRHNTKGVEMVRAKWGDQAAKAAEIHIRRDCNGKLLTPEEFRDHYGIRVEDITTEDID